MEILKCLQWAFSRCLGRPDQGDEKEPVLEREEIGLSEIPEAIEALICEIRGLAARQREPLGYDDIMDLIEGLLDVEGNGSGDADLLCEAMEAVDALVRGNPEISSEWYNERMLGKSPVFVKSLFDVSWLDFPR